MNSVVHTGVKSPGCEKRTTHLPLRLESLIGPKVVLAVKSGAFIPILRQLFSIIVFTTKYILISQYIL